jgi:subtilisin family serine protease
MKNYNVVFEKDINIENLLSSMTNQGIVVNRIFTSMQVVNVSCESEDVFTNISGVLDIEEDLSTEVHPSNSEWHQLRIISNALPMKEKYFPLNHGDGVKVYLIDSGINATLPELVDANIVNCYSFNGDFSDELGHGTAMASLIVGSTLGVATNVELKNVRIEMAAVINISDLLLAFDAILQDRTDITEVAVVNCSWTIPRSKILDTKIKELQDSNFVVVAAAGNTMSDANNLSPVGLDTVIGVGASDPYDRVISWGGGAGSNWGPDVDIFAPGIGVNVLNIDGTIKESSGTSLAAALTSGVVAQYIKDLNSTNNLTAYHIQFIVINSGITDILFRNESIYGTTPNSILYISSFDKFIKNIPKEKINVQIGTEYELILELNDQYAYGIDIDDVVFGNIRRYYPEWVTIDTTTNTIRFSPTDVNYVKNTRIFIKVVDQNDTQLEVYPLLIGTYINDPEESTTEEVYQYKEENGTIVVIPAACEGFCFQTCGAIPPKGYSCGCSNGECFTQA